MNTHELTFKLEKETKNTVRYAEVLEDGESPVVGTLYVQKTYLPTTRPEVINVTIGISVPAWQSWFVWYNVVSGLEFGSFLIKSLLQKVAMTPFRPEEHCVGWGFVVGKPSLLVCGSL